MANYTITLTEISAEMLDELANFAHTAWGRTDILEVDVMPNLGTSQASLSAVEMAIPQPKSATSSIEIILPPEPIEDSVDEGPKPKRAHR